MKKRLTAGMLALCLALSLFGTVFAAGGQEGIVVLYTNDVHCAVDDNIGYAGLAAYKAEMEALYGEGNVTLVDAGDAVQGAAIGTLSKGEYIVEIMNEVGYDVLVPGNHEFDYGIDRMFELMEMHDGVVVCSNFVDLDTGKAVFDPYTVIDYGDVQVAYIGVTTPKTFTSSTPRYFQDDKGNFIYGFSEDSTGEALYAVVQGAIDSAKADGADYVIAVGHIGVEEDLTPWQSTDIIAHTSGLNAFIDAHSHSTIEGEIKKDKAGKDVVLTSTGTKLAAIGKLVIGSDGVIATQLVKEYTNKDATIDEFVKSVQAENAELLNTVVASTKVPLIVNDPETGKRLVRSRETNLGDLAADAYRKLLGADVAVVNGGGVRADIPAGDITYDQIIAVHPFGNEACVVEANGQEILDLLEMASRVAPNENGGFLQVSGLSYNVHTDIPSSVVLDDKGSFVKVDGQYRVQNVMVGEEPLDPQKTYTLASHNYMIKNGGDGLNMFMDNTLLQDEVMLDNQVLIQYIVEELGGVVGDEYGNVYGQGRIAVYMNPFTDAQGQWYSDSVSYFYTQGVVNGTSDAEFSPDVPMTRAMFVTLLYRMAGSPAVSKESSDVFLDCPADSWYSDAVVWASEWMPADADSLFEPDAELTRQDMAFILYQYTKSEGGGFAGASTFVPEYSDVAEIDYSSYEAVAYFAMKGIMNGSDAGKFSPKSLASRAMGVTVLHRFDAAD